MDISAGKKPNPVHTLRQTQAFTKWFGNKMKEINTNLFPLPKNLLGELHQWFSSFLMLQPFNTVPPVAMTPTIKLFSLLLHNCNFATVMKYDVNF